MKINCIYNTLNLIEKNFAKPITIEELENTACYSYRNIQRIFKYACGETIGGYQKRLKLENAFKLMLYTTKTLTDIAIEVGFENIATFSKAFKQHYDISPREARRSKNLLFKQASITPTISGIKLHPEIVYIPSKTVYYQGINTDYENKEIELLWEAFFTNDFPQQNTEYYGIIADDPLITEKIKCRYEACSTLQSSTKKLPSKTLFDGRYAKFMHAGRYEKIEETYRQIYAGWILNSELEFGCTPIIEHYINHSENTSCSDEYITAILIPLHV